MQGYDYRGNSQLHEDEPTELVKICEELGAAPDNDRFGPDEETWHAGSHKEGGHWEGRGETGSAVVDNLAGASRYQRFLYRTTFLKHVPGHVGIEDCGNAKVYCYKTLLSWKHATFSV